MKDNLRKLYDTYYVAREFERLDLFQLLADTYDIRSALYPGSFVHITPSFVYPVTTYIDMDTRARAFFNHTNSRKLVAQHKRYPEEATITFHSIDYRAEMKAVAHDFDLLISQYAGFVSQYCRQHLKIGGMLLANDSHGDASMASIDPAYQLIAVILNKNGKPYLSSNHLHDYFIPIKPTSITREYLQKTQKGAKYKKTAHIYLFRRIT